MVESTLPRWRGLNLQAKCMEHEEREFRKEHFKSIADWGFDFARLPMDYRCWTGDDWLDFDESALAEIDDAI